MLKVLSGKTSLILVCLTLAFATGAVNAQDEYSDYAPPDTTFQEIRLADGEVEAVDTSGYDWYYDFELGTFVAGTRDPGEAGGVEPDGDSPEDFIRHEERCTEEKRVRTSVDNVLVGYDEYVDGNILTYGRVTVKGWVKGDVRSYNRVMVTSSGRVDGDIIAPEIIVKDGGIVHGTVVETDKDEDGEGGVSVPGIIVVVSLTALFLFMGFLVVTLMPRQLDNFSTCLNENRTKTYVVGFLMLPGMALVVLLLSITVVGIVLVPLVPFVYIFAIIMGVVSFGDVIGKLLSRGVLGTRSSLLFRSMVGILILMGFWFVTATLLSSNYGVAEGFGILFLVLAIIISSYPLCTGIGAALLTRFGFKPCASGKERRRAGIAPAPAPPPIPKAPPEPTPSAFDDNSDETSS